MKRPRARALTVVEVMVSIVILTTGVLITMAAISFGVKATTTTSQSTEASAYARRLLEIILAGGPRGPVAPGNALNPLFYGPSQTFLPLYSNESGPPPPFLTSDFVQADDPLDVRRFASQAQNYSVRVRVDRLSSNIYDFQYGLVNVTVDLSWSDKLGPRVLTTSGIFKE